MIYTKLFYSTKRFFSFFLMLFFLVFFGCKKELKYKDVILITGTETSNLINYTLDQAPATISLTASATALAAEDISVKFELDSNLVKQYNNANNTTYYFPPSTAIQLSNGSVDIKKGQNVSEAIAIKLISTNPFVDGRNYLIPVRLSVVNGAMDVLKSSSVAFVKLNRVITTNVLDFNNPPAMDTLYDKSVSLSQFTLEFRVNVAQFASSFHISRVLAFSDGENNGNFNLWRFGELSDEINQLQWINGKEGAKGKISSRTLFATNTWYTISSVFDGTNCSMYVNGVLDGSFKSTLSSYTFKSFNFGFSGQNLNGKLGEIRLWNKALSPNEIQNNLCSVDPTAAGLVAYWKLNEGSGNTLADYSGHGYNIQPKQGTLRWVTGVKCPN